jgi:hypothetical protein
VQDGLLTSVGKGTVYSNQEFRDFHCRLEAKASADFQDEFGLRRQSKGYASVYLGGPRDKEYRGSIHRFGPEPRDEVIALAEKELTRTYKIDVPNKKIILIVDNSEMPKLHLEFERRGAAR